MESVSALSAGVYATTLLVMVDSERGCGCTPSITRLGLFYPHDGMYATKWPSPLCVYSVFTVMSLSTLACAVKHKKHRFLNCILHRICFLVVVLKPACLAKKIAQYKFQVLNNPSPCKSTRQPWLETALQTASVSYTRKDEGPLPQLQADAAGQQQPELPQHQHCCHLSQQRSVEGGFHQSIIKITNWLLQDLKSFFIFFLLTMKRICGFYSNIITWIPLQNKFVN